MPRCDTLAANVPHRPFPRVHRLVICGSCGTENELGRKFCGECGSRLAVVCATCGTSNAPGAKFCGECGSSLVAEDPARQVARPAVAPLNGQGTGPVAELRLVSVLFADLVGFTTIAE